MIYPILPINHTQERGKLRPWKELADTIDGYLSFIGTVVSIVCYTLSLTTFKLFPQTLPLGLVVLCISFLLLDMLYVVISGLYATKTAVNAEFCKCLAIATHFGMILVQTCSVLSAVDIATKFGILEPNRQRGTLAKYLCKRTPVLISLSLVLVVAALTLDHMDIVDMGYGEHGACLFNGYYGRLIFYVIPNSISLIFTFSLVLFTLHKIRKQKMRSRATFKGCVRSVTGPQLMLLKSP